MSGKMIKVSGSLVQMEKKGETKLYESVHLGTDGIIGEVRRLTKDTAWVLAYESADGLKPGDLAEPRGIPLQMELGPGLLGGVYDGLGRSLEALYAKTGDRISPGTEVSALDRTKRWVFHPSVTVGTKVVPGDSIGTVQETAQVAHKIMVPMSVSGTVAEVHNGERTIEEVLVIVKAPDGTDHKLTMIQNWAIRAERSYKQKHRTETQIRSLDMSQGSSVQLSSTESGREILSKLIPDEAVDVIVCIASGLTGRECVALIETCKAQAEPKTVLITSPADTKAAAQEAAIYRGLAIAAYYRDMGLHTALLIDNLTPWLGTTRETAELFEQAGFVTCLGTEKRQGSLSIIGILPAEEGGCAND